MIEINCGLMNFSHITVNSCMCSLEKEINITKIMEVQLKMAGICQTWKYPLVYWEQVTILAIKSSSDGLLK